MSTETRDSGICHSEGGWPKEVNAKDDEVTARFRRRVEKEDNWAPKMKTLMTVGIFYPPPYPSFSFCCSELIYCSRGGGEEEQKTRQNISLFYYTSISSNFPSSSCLIFTSQWSSVYCKITRSIFTKTSSMTWSRGNWYCHSG